MFEPNKMCTKRGKQNVRCGILFLVGGSLLGFLGATLGMNCGCRTICVSKCSVANLSIAAAAVSRCETDNFSRT